jgi:uncharacterized phosphosugar-binding protein
VSNKIEFESSVKLNIGQKYLDYLYNLFDRLTIKQASNIEEASNSIVDAILAGNAIYAYGNVHSALAISDCYVRGGGFALLNQIMVPALNSPEYDPPELWIDLERLEGYGGLIFKHTPAKSGDLLIVVSTSGRNPVPIEMGIFAKERGLKIIAVTSMEYTLSVPSRHSSGKHLYEIADVVIDNMSIPGDAVLSHDQVPVKFCATSGVVDFAIMQILMAETIERLSANGFPPLIFLDRDLDGCEEYNLELHSKLIDYKDRILFKFR